jgi:cyclophilin family peptidyl-prolyl cis-trans isomerase
MRPFALIAAALAALVSAPALAQGKDAQPATAPHAVPPATNDKENLWLLDLSTGGRVEIWLRPDVAPKMVERIKTLTRQHFYDGLTFHRVIDGFMAQGGDPAGDGTGGSQLPNVPAEFNYLPHVRGAVAAARAQEEDSANSQFYIVMQPRLQLDRKYTVFGRVLTGMPYVDAIERGEPPANPTRILHAYVAADNPPPYQPAVAAPVTLAPVLPGTKPNVAPKSVARPAARK